MKFRLFYITSLSLLIHILPASAQQNTYIINGIILDSARHTPLVSATVYLKNPSDSTIISLSLSGEDGTFILKNIPKNKPVSFNVFYAGYKPFHLLLNQSKDSLHLDTIYLAPSLLTLKEITITDQAPPITIRGDTVVFNAASFKVHPNSVLSDLLKKLSGVEVDKAGNITAYGKRVDKILVQGKSFFGNDLMIALKNIPAAIVNKVEITDTKTLEEEITDEPASGDTKTINITLKKGMDHGVFGRAYVGYGTGKHYDASSLMNYFEGNRQISLLGATNNINEIGFTMNEIRNMMGSGARYVTVNSAGGFGINGINFGSVQDGLKKKHTIRSKL